MEKQKELGEIIDKLQTIVRHTNTIYATINNIITTNERTVSCVCACVLDTVHFHSKFDIKQAMKKWHFVSAILQC